MSRQAVNTFLNNVAQWSIAFLYAFLTQCLLSLMVVPTDSFTLS